jgi:hypothetical protein
MKLAVAFVGAFLALAVSGPNVFKPNTPLSREQLAEIAVPNWLALPSTPFISSIEHTGEAGMEASFGTIAYVLPSDGSSEVTWFKEHLKADGYTIEDRTAAIDNFIGADTVISASQQATGRRVILVRTNTLDGADLRVVFEDPQAGAQVSEL